MFDPDDDRREAREETRVLIERSDLDWLIDTMRGGRR